MSKWAPLFIIHSTIRPQPPYVWIIHKRLADPSDKVTGVAQPSYGINSHSDFEPICTMLTDHIHKSERLVHEAINPEQDLTWFQELRSDPSVAQWLLPFVIAPWSKAQAEKSLVTEGALVQ